MILVIIFVKQKTIEKSYVVHLNAYKNKQMYKSNIGTYAVNTV